MMEDISVHINNKYKVEFSRDPLAHKTKMRLKEKWKSPWGPDFYILCEALRMLLFICI